MGKRRYISNIIEDISFKYKKMAFISGPRQVGKTTLSKEMLSLRKKGNYCNWDDKDFRKIWIKGPKDFLSMLNILTEENFSKPLLVLDELHKDKRWKSNLKGLFDLFGSELDILVTGSARLNIFKRGGDSLLGRYFSFRLHPLSVAELNGSVADSPFVAIEDMFHEKKWKHKSNQTVFDRLMNFGGFPDPYFNQDVKFLNLWRSGRLEKLIREDLRDLSQLPELSQVELLATLLPDKVGSPLSIQSLREDIEVSYDTVKRWLKYLETLYFHFGLKPYSKKIQRSLKKETKIYLYDWSEIEDLGVKFENLVASHLLKACDFWTDSGLGKWQLHYLRNKEKKEVDFLITHSDKAVVSFECKYSDTNLDRSFLSFAKQIGLKRHVQIVAKENIWQRSMVQDVEVLVASADLVLSKLV